MLLVLKLMGPLVKSATIGKPDRADSRAPLGNASDSYGADALSKDIRSH